MSGRKRSLVRVRGLTRAGVDDGRDGEGGAGRMPGSRATPADQPEPGGWARWLPRSPWQRDGEPKGEGSGRRKASLH